MRQLVPITNNRSTINNQLQYIINNPYTTTNSLSINNDPLITAERIFVTEDVITIITKHISYQAFKDSSNIL